MRLKVSAKTISGATLAMSAAAAMMTVPTSASAVGIPSGMTAMSAVAAGDRISAETASSGARAAYSPENKIKCMGVNSCKGRSACKTANSKCKGHNSCKGKGFLMLTKAKCDTKKAAMKES